VCVCVCRWGGGVLYDRYYNKKEQVKKISNTNLKWNVCKINETKNIGSLFEVYVDRQTKSVLIFLFERKVYICSAQIHQINQKILKLLQKLVFK